jgi:CPA1 family monovalent cation:H+ antiporter
LTRSLPRRNVTILRAESLVNDGTALVLYAIAVAAIVEGTTPGVLEVVGLFALSYAGGLIAGLMTG